MKFIIFNIGNYEYYNGIENKSLNIYEKFYQEKKSNNPEIYNFQDYNGYCYGFSSLSDGKLNLSTFKFKQDTSKLFEDITVVWVTQKDDKFVLVGWYKNASVYNFLQKKISYPSVGRDLYFNVKASSKNCFLIPFNERNFFIDIPFRNEKNFYISEDEDKINKHILEYIENYSGTFSNIVLSDSILNQKLENPPENAVLLSKRASIYLYNEGNFLEALKYLNTALDFTEQLDEKSITDIHYFKALCFLFLNCFEKSISEYKIVLEKINYDLNIIKNVIYLYLSIEDYKNTIMYCQKILDTEQHSEEVIPLLEEIKCIQIDCLINIGDIHKAKGELQKIISTTKSKTMSTHCKSILDIIEKEC